MKIQVLQKLSISHLSKSCIFKKRSSGIEVYAQTANNFYNINISSRELDISSYLTSKLFLNKCFKLSSRKLINSLFKHFDFQSYNMNGKYISADLFWNEFIKCNARFQKYLSSPHNELRYGKRGLKEITNFLKFCKALTSDDLISIYMLYTSLTEKTLEMTVQKIFTEYIQTYGVLFINFLTNVTYFSNDKLRIYTNLIKITKQMKF